MRSNDGHSAGRIGRRALAGAALATALARPALAQRAPEHATIAIAPGVPVEHLGGFAQAIAAGLYRRRGIEVTLRGPADAPFRVLPDCDAAFDMLHARQPWRVIAAIGQKDTAALIARPETGFLSLQQVKAQPLVLRGGARASWWAFLRNRFGYTDSQILPETDPDRFFLDSRTAVIEGQAGVQARALGQALGAEPAVLLPADEAFPGYGILLAAAERDIGERPDHVRRFLTATLEGWYSYLYTDPAPAHALLKPERSLEAMAFARAALLRRGIVDSGEAESQGIGAMNAQRWARIARISASQGHLTSADDPSRAFTLGFTNQRAGMALKKRMF